jgi:surfactin family lipopeptide synthetase A
VIVANLLIDLLQKGVTLWAEGQDLFFEASEDTLTPSLREQVLTHKTEIVALLGERRKHLSVSYGQQRLWFLDQLEPGSATYNIFRALHLSGRLEAMALEQSLNTIVQRHETLHTTFITIEGHAVQVIVPVFRVTLPIVDLQTVSLVKREDQARQLAVEEAQRPFDLAQGPLLRMTLLRLGEEEHVLLLTMHHIVSDGWSMGILIREVATLYQAYLQGEPPQLPELPVQYADYAAWQREWLRGETLEQQLRYWQEHLRDVPAQLELPTDRRRPAVQSYRGAREPFELPGALVERLKRLSQREGGTLFMTLLAAFDVLLYRYTGQTDLVVGTPIAGRTQSEVEGLIGFFVNTLALRVDVGGNPTFRELLRRVREVALGGYTHQDLPFERLVEELGLERDLSRNPLFQVMFILQNVPMPSLELPGLALRILRLDPGIAQFDLMLDLWERSEGIEGCFEYSTDLFDSTIIARMAKQFQTLLESIADDPTQRLADLSLLTETERQQVLVTWNDTGTKHSQNSCLHDLFEEQVERTPDAVAVTFRDQHLTYRELNRRASQLACHLRRLGVKPEVRVGICVERSLEMAFGILGILKAGGTYVPLDPSHPEERLDLILQDTQITVLLTLQQFSERFFHHEMELICLDSDWGQVAQESVEGLKSDAMSANLAYIIYTSGSTGAPKGILTSHQAAADRSLALVERFRLDSTDRVLQFAPINFDVSVEELYPTWFVGATLVLADGRVLAPNWELTRLVEQVGLTVLNLPSSFWHEWVLELGSSGGRLPLSLRMVIVGSERVSPERLAEWQAMDTSHISWINAYGPTETTVSCVHYGPDNLENVKGRSQVPVGRPLPDTQLYLLDPHLQPVPILVPGEIYIGGRGLARGYLHRPELTAEKFIPNLFSDELGARLYKTGDLGRYLSDGDLEFLGRVDHQLKIRGFRIEPEEIEAVLSKHSDIREALVTVREDASGDMRLVAYIVPSWKTDGDEHEKELLKSLVAHLKRHLPDYMLPSAFVLLGSLPRTSTGKVNRLALPPPRKDGIGLDTSFVPPRTPTEKVLADIWTRVLRLENVSVHDDFFRLGGHSLLATRVVSQIREVFKIELPLRSMLETRTIAGLAIFIDTVQWAAHGPRANATISENDLEEGAL